MPDPNSLAADLADEGAALDALVAPLTALRAKPRGSGGPPPETTLPDLTNPTPAEGWTIAHQISHLAWTDRQTILAATDPSGFEKMVRRAVEDAGGYVEEGAAEGVGEPPSVLLERWRAGRREVIDVLSAAPQGTRIPWFGPPMKPASMITARLMETWAHGQDVADALGADREPTGRLRHVAHIGVRTRDFAYLNRGLEAPSEQFRVVLNAPDGSTWTWGPEDAGQSVSGPALDFCLLVTQRRNRADLALTASGPDADRWLDLAQAFAGPPGPGRPPLA